MKIKRGTIRDDGKIFFGYTTSGILKKYKYERWLTPESFEKSREAERISKAKYRKTEKGKQVCKKSQKKWGKKNPEVLKSYVYNWRNKDRAKFNESRRKTYARSAAKNKANIKE